MKKWGIIEERILSWKALYNISFRRLPSPLGPPSSGSAKLRPSPPSSASLAGRTAPLKASHKTGHPAPLPENRPMPSRRTSEGSIARDSKSKTVVGEVARTDLVNKPDRRYQVYEGHLTRLQGYNRPRPRPLNLRWGGLGVGGLGTVSWKQSRAGDEGRCNAGT